MVGAPFVSRELSSILEEPTGSGWKDESLDKSSWPAISFPERKELGVPVLEDLSLVGEIDLARSVESH